MQAMSAHIVEEWQRSRRSPAAAFLCYPSLADQTAICPQFGRISILTVLRADRSLVACCAGMSKVPWRAFPLPTGRWLSFPGRASAAKPHSERCC